MIPKLTQRLALLFAIAASGFSICGCDGGIHVKGRVYAQSSSVGESQAFIDQSHPVGSDLIPIKGARVTLYHAGDYSQEKADKSELRKSSSLTDSAGGFEVGGLTSPFRFNAGLVVEKEGYKTVTKIFYHDKINHDAIVILVPETKSGGNPGKR